MLRLDATNAVLPPATAARGKYRGQQHYTSIKDPLPEAQRMGCQMEEIKFEYVNEEEPACRHGGRGKSCLEKEVGHRTGRMPENPSSL